MKTNIAILLIVGTLTYLLTLYLSGNSEPKINEVPDTASVHQTVKSDQTIPSFAFTDLKGKQHAIEDYQGKVVILNFWASWCAPCIKEFPNLIKAAREHNKDAVLIALSSDMDEDAIHKFITKMDIDLETSNIVIALDKNQEITAKQFQTFKLPETIIIDKNLNLRHKLVGADWQYEDLDTIIKNLTNE